MLQAMRDGAGAKVLKIALMSFLVLAVAGLVLSDVGGFFRGGGVPANAVAKGSGISIGASEFDQTVRRMMATQNMTPQEAYQRGMIHMILGSEIQQRLLTKKALSLGLRAGDDVVTSQMAKIAQEIAPAGGGSKADTLKQILRSQGISEAEFVSAIRQETANSVLRTALTAGSSVIPASLTSDLYMAENQTRDVRAITLPFASIKDFEQPDEDSLTKYYEANKPLFAIPETRTITLATLNRTMIENKIEVTDDELKETYEEHISSYTKPERRRLQQAIVSDAAEAEKIAAAVKGGKSLKDAAGKNFIGEEAYQQSGLLEEIAKPAFTAKEKAVIGPVQTALGYHVMVLSKILPPEVTPFADVKGAIKEEILQVRLMDDLLAAGNDIDDRLAGGENLDAIVKEMGLTTQKIGPFRQNGSDSAGKDLFKDYSADKMQIIEAAFDADKGESAPIIETADSRFLVVHVDDATPLSHKPYEEVKETLRGKWVEEQQKLLNQTRARDAHKRLQDGEKLEDIAKALGVSIQTFNNIKRDGDAPKALGPVAQTRLFQVPANDYILAEQESGVAIAAVTAIKFPSSAPKSTEGETAALETAMRNETLSLFVSDLTSRSKVKVNEALLQQMYGQQTPAGM